MSVADRARLEAIVVDRNSPQKHVWRAQIVLLTGDGVGTNEIMRRTGTSKVTVWRWQERFMRAGVAGLVRDKTRPSRIPPLPASVCERTVALTLGDPPGETTHWTAAMMAKAVGISVSSVHRIWRAHGLQPHRAREFKLSRDPDFVSKLRDIVGLYVDPPAHDPRQLRQPQTPQGAGLAGSPSAFRVPLHTNLGLMAQCRRGLLREANETTAETRRVPITGRPSSRHQPLPR